VELQEAIANRRSIKKFKHDVEIDDKALYQAIEQAADAPNNGMREPWRMIHITKDRLGDMSEAITPYAFPDSVDKQQDHYQTVTRLGGILVLVVKTDPRQRQNRENFFALGAYAQNLMLLLHEAGIGTCWKTPPYIFEPKVRKIFGIAGDEAIAGLLYLTDLSVDMPHVQRKNKNLIEKF